MNKFENLLLEYGERNNKTQCEDLVKECDINILIELIKARINHSKFMKIWDYLLKGLRFKEPDKKRLDVIKATLYQLEINDLPTSEADSIISRLNVELPQFSSEELISLCQYCLHSLQKGVTSYGWKSLIPEALNLLTNKNYGLDNDVETSAEYKSNFINCLCMLEWPANIIVHIASMFEDVLFSNEEYTKITSKLTSYLEKLTSQEMPVFVYHLLKLYNKGHSSLIFVKLQNYFDAKIYSRPLFTRAALDSNEVNSDSIDDALDDEIIDVESTILYHIHQAAESGRECIANYIATLKNLIKAPEFILHPFQLGMLFSISTIGALRDKVVEILRASVARTLNEQNKRNCWFKTMIPANVCKVEAIIRRLIPFSLSHQRDLVIEGMVNFSYVLLGVKSALGREGDPIVEKQWTLGTTIIFFILKKKRQIAPSVISTIEIDMSRTQGAAQYIDCLKLISAKTPLVLLENINELFSLMENLILIQGSDADKLLDIFIPLAKINTSVRDRLIILLRKSLYARSVEVKKRSVIGFLRLISSFNISNMACLSQYPSSSMNCSYSLMTQLTLASKTMPNCFSNEGICLEIVEILRRCLMQLYEEKVSFYDGLCNTICSNVELGIPLLDMLWRHFSNFYEIDEDKLPPLTFNKIASTRDQTVTCNEPLGKLILCCGIVTHNVLETHSHSGIVKKFEETLESLCDRMINTELIHFGFDDGGNLSDGSVESQQKLTILGEGISVYEALIAYKVLSWDQESEGIALKVNNLFQSYMRLCEFAKNLAKPKKDDAKRKKQNADKSTESIQSVQKSTQNVQKSTHPFKIPFTIINFQANYKLLSLLHKTVDWTNLTELNKIRTKTEIHKYALRTLYELLFKSKTSKHTLFNRKINELPGIGKILFDCCIAKINEFIDFDPSCAVMAAECFHLIIQDVCIHFKPEKLHKIVGRDEEESLGNILSTLLCAYKEIFNLIEDEDINAEAKKLPLIAINTLILLVPLIPSESTVYDEIWKWMRNITQNKIINHNKALLNNFINLLLMIYVKFQDNFAFIETLALKVTHEIGTINQVEQDVEDFTLINETSAPSALQCVCNTLKVILDDFDWIIGRFRAEYGVIVYSEGEIHTTIEQLKSKERNLCAEMCTIVPIVSILCNTSLRPGVLTEAVFKIICHLYNTLNSLTKYFLTQASKANPTFQAARFDRVVKSAGKHLSDKVYNFIMHIEQSQNEEANAETKKKRKDSDQLKNKILRETRMIPKVVYEIEQFGKTVTQLSNRTKVDLNKYVGTGAVRDFRIKGLKELIENADKRTVTSQESITIEETDEESMDVEEEKNGTDSESFFSGQQSKRRRTSSD